VIGRLAVLACLALASRAHAQGPEGPPISDELRRAYEAGDYESARRELLKAYAVEPRTELLFALGQVELNLGNYEAAIRYYERFIAQKPSDEQVALAQQAIGAARMRMAAPTEASPPEPAPAVVRDQPRIGPRQWYVEDSGLIALGGASILVGGGLLYYSHRLGTDRSGTLSDYDDRVSLSRSTKWTGAALAAAGAVTVAVTVVRWRLRPDGSDLVASITPGAATFVLTSRW
jgi:tetratricopeptide (TPR) repeat protein